MYDFKNLEYSEISMHYFWAFHYTLNSMYKNYVRLLYSREKNKIKISWFRMKLLLFFWIFGCTVPLRAQTDLSVWRWFVMFIFHFMMESIGTSSRFLSVQRTWSYSVLFWFIIYDPLLSYFYDSFMPLPEEKPLPPCFLHLL